ncbi:hypothetical protein TanjilG_12663 [Lupinus angustifolius]|uniref:FAF domain-containing protein n=1 Tax=Lupinus angustifolius TaxID=3871 RepID=A0A4P1QZ36_LUPAN|nr:hypothetical protein TanjilG_12663 [Lupinus angustifolius]
MNSNNFTKLPLNNDEYIGTESCIDLQNEIDFNHFDKSKTNTSVLIKSGSKKKEKREFPPTIPLLVGSHNNNNMLWIMKRYYTSDGRLVLKEEKVKYHEYFRAHRANGRLTLELACSP